MNNIQNTIPWQYTLKMALSSRFLCGRAGKTKLEASYSSLVNHLLKTKLSFLSTACFRLCNMISMLRNKYENRVEVLNRINLSFILIPLSNIQSEKYMLYKMILKLRRKNSLPAI